MAAGGSVVVNAEEYTALELCSIAAAAQNGGGNLIIRHASRFSSMESRGIAASGKNGCVVFNFTD